AGAGGAAADRPRLHVQGGRRTPERLGEDDREPRLQRPAQAPAVHAPRADALGDRASARLSAAVSAGTDPSAASVPRESRATPLRPAPRRTPAPSGRARPR